MSRRALASALASRFRLIDVLERFATRPALVVLLYHRIARPEECVYDRAVIEATPDQFDDQMQMLRRRHSVVDPEELVDLVLRPRSLTRLRVAVTFDDGYRDNYTVAFPILRSHGLKALFFLPTRFVGGLELTWWDRIAYAIRRTKRAEIAIDFPKATTVRIDPHDRDAAIGTVLRIFKREGGHTDERRFLEMLERACDVSLPDKSDDRQFFSWEEALEMEKAGMGIGSHTHSHRILAGLPGGEQQSECAKSLAELKERKFRVADYLAYPVGSRETFTDETKRVARDSGYRLGFSNYGGINLPGQIDPFDVKRIGMSLTENASQLRFRIAASATVGRNVW